jgi:hypothetical protein
LRARFKFNHAFLRNAQRFDALSRIETATSDGIAFDPRKIERSFRFLMDDMVIVV